MDDVAIEKQSSSQQGNLISELKIRIAALEQQNQLLKDILDEIPCSVYWKNIDSVYLGRNEAALQKMLEQGFEAKANKNFVVGKTDYDLLPQEIANQFRNNDLKVLNSQQAETYNESFTTKTGKLYHHLSIKKAILDTNGLPKGIVGISVDVTAQKLAEERANAATQQALIAESKAEAEEALRKAVMMLSGSIVHDLKNSITALSWLGTSCQQELPKIIMGYNKAVEKKLVVNDIPSYALESIADTGARVARMVSHFKEFINTSLKTLRAAVNKQLRADDLICCKVSHCLRTFETGFFCTPEDKQLITISQEYDFDFMGNEILFVRILVNLVTNALEQIKKHQTGNILIATEESKQFNMIRIKDTAGGMSAEVLAHLFDGFNSSKEDGNGIGLAFCKFVMKSFGGDITCNAKEGDYAEFVLTFPKKNKKN